MRRLAMYIYQQEEWPQFKWNQIKLAPLLANVRHLQGKLLGHMEALGFDFQREATLNTLTQDVIKTSEIEGERLDLQQVRSSVANRLGINIGKPTYVDHNVEGIVEILLDATKNYNSKLTKERLFDWHSALFPTGRSGSHRITVGKWRDVSSGDMQIVSGSFGREKVYYEAPSYDCLEVEMNKFITWFNCNLDIDLVIKAAIAHFWFITIHPFDDGNGRIARAIADMVLAKSEDSALRFYSMSSQILRERQDYYNMLEKCQKGAINITLWIEWFLSCLERAIKNSENLLKTVLTKADFWRKHAGSSFNERQRKIINQLLDGFEGKLTSSKWAKISKCSQDTALRDITALLNQGVLVKENGGGRSTCYVLEQFERRYIYRTTV